MLRNIYFIVILTFLMACGGGSNNTTSELDNNATSESTEEVESNTTSNSTEGVGNNTTSGSTEEVGNSTTSDSTEETGNNVTSDNTEELEDDTVSDNTEEADNNNDTSIDKLGKAQLGVLSQATVRLYELNKLERKLLATTTTSTGDSIEGIGNFNLFLEKLESDKLYLYEVSNGDDFDVNDDGIIDEQSTPNQGTFHLLVLGSHIKSIGKANVTAISEIVYQKLISSLSLESTELISLMKSLTQELIQADINNDGFIGIEDLLKYNPVIDENKLSIEYQDKLSQVISDILTNKTSDFTTPQFENNNTNITINENLQFIQQIKINDSSTLSVTLLGTDSNQFKYDISTQELSFIEKIDFENPKDNNLDNVFELTIQATDSYFNTSSKEFTIEVLDLNETIPEVPELKDSNLSINENNGSNSFIGTISLHSEGTSAILSYTLIGEDSQYFDVSTQGEVFSKQDFDYETKSTYRFNLQASNSVGISNEVEVQIQINNIADIQSVVQSTTISTSENRSIGTLIGQLNVLSSGDSDISGFNFYGSGNNKFEADTDGDLKVLSYLDYESTSVYYLQYTASNDAGESERANLTIYITNIFENSGSDYPKTETGIQTALDNADYSFILNQLLNNRDSYTTLDDDVVNMNIAAAYVGSSGYTVFDITSSMSEGNTSSFNDFVNNITEDNDALSSINSLNLADTYYSNIVQGVDCTDTATLTQLEESSCYNLGLVRLTSLTNSVKLLFGGDSDTVQKWAEGVDSNSTDDLNENNVLDNSEAAACAVVYANNPSDSCQDSTFHSYKGRVTFNKDGQEHNATLIEVDVGNATNGYQSFYQLISADANNNTPLLTSGICDKNFNMTNNIADGITYFPCPVIDDSGDSMGIKESLEQVANIQSLFPDGDETKTTVESYLENITGSTDGTIGLDNLSDYLREN